ncbi:TniQ family protein [Parafrankia sp. EUN1f]|uniref:TniQ family protein n=1 Tax=Parafrankia sp. EUN1f TaxID=102897 RepID=UPI000A078A58
MHLVSGTIRSSLQDRMVMVFGARSPSGSQLGRGSARRVGDQSACAAGKSSKEGIAGLRPAGPVQVAPILIDTTSRSGRGGPHSQQRTVPTATFIATPHQTVSDPDRSPRPLPIRPRPIAGESPTAYVRRLAEANHVRPGHLRRLVDSRPSDKTTIRMDWLAALAGRTLPDLQRALTSPARRQAHKPELFAAIRHDAQDSRLSLRFLARRHGVTRRTVSQALNSPTPTPRKKLPPRGSRLDPFKPEIDAMLRADNPDPPRTIRQITDQLREQHPDAGLTYSMIRPTSAGTSTPNRSTFADTNRHSAPNQDQNCRRSVTLNLIRPGQQTRIGSPCCQRSKANRGAPIRPPPLGSARRPDPDRPA